MKKLYLVFAIIGAAIPLAFFVRFFGTDQGAGQIGFISALFVNDAASGFASDLLISSFVFWAYMWSKCKAGPSPWLFMIINLTIGLSCALPAYLYIDTRQKISQLK